MSANRSAVRNRVNPLLRTEVQAVRRHFQRAALEKGPSKKKRNARVHCGWRGAINICPRRFWRRSGEPRVISGDFNAVRSDTRDERHVLQDYW